MLKGRFLRHWAGPVSLSAAGAALDLHTGHANDSEKDEFSEGGVIEKGVSVLDRK